MYSQPRKILAIVALLGYLFLALFGLVGFSSHTMHSRMPMQDCPYAIGTHSLCSMDVFGHIRGWENATRTLLPSFVLFIILAVFSMTRPKELDNSPPLFLRRRRERQYSPYTVLFSRGILNPKVP